MKTPILAFRQGLGLSFLLSCTLLVSTAAMPRATSRRQPQDQQQAPSSKKDSAETAPSGAALYKQFCAACHGNDLKGNGPAPAPFKDVPPDLTTLAQRHGGKFPATYVMNVLRNGVTVRAHEPPEMPTWDADFKAGYGLSEAQVTLRITRLTAYIKSLQAKPSGN